MAVVTVAQLLARARSAADMEDDYPTREELLRWLNVDRQRLGVMIARHGMVLDGSTDSITATGAASYSIGSTEDSEPLAVWGVYEVSTQNGRLRRIKSADFMDAFQFLNVEHVGRPRQYWLAQGANGQLSIKFSPNPASGTFIIGIVAAPAVLTDDDDEVNYPGAWEEWLVLSMACRALAKEESSTAEMRRQMREIESHIETHAWDRAFAANQRVRNVDRVERGWDDGTVPPSAEWYWL